MLRGFIFGGQALQISGIRSMADIQLKTVSSWALLQYHNASCSPAVGRLLTTPDTLPQSRSVTATRLTTSSTVVPRPKERLLLSMTHHTHACALMMFAFLSLVDTLPLIRCVAFKKAYTSLCPIMWVRSFSAEKTRHSGNHTFYTHYCYMMFERLIVVVFNSSQHATFCFPCIDRFCFENKCA
jgi:hypothetical protein